jgi:hypothetical protein
MIPDRTARLAEISTTGGAVAMYADVDHRGLESWAKHIICEK